MGGGDDLASDDEYLQASVAHERNHEEIRNELAAGKKRQRDDSASLLDRERIHAADSSDADSGDEAEYKEDVSHKNKKSILNSTVSSDRLLLQAGRDLIDQPVEQQSTFLTIAVKQNWSNSADQNEAASPEFSPRYFVTSKKESLAEKIRDAVSVKKLRTWKREKSPAVLIVCISARRSVEILKELASLKIRVAKLFPKHGSVSEQAQELRKYKQSVAVGTPHRLAALCARGSLLFAHTQLLVLDAAASQKQFTVCTLPDTAPHCATLLQYAAPHLKASLKLAFF